MTDLQTQTLHTMMLAYSALELLRRSSEGADAAASKSIQMKLEQAIEMYTKHFVRLVHN